jgi:RNA-directed DNA polymerase
VSRHTKACKLNPVTHCVCKKPTEIESTGLYAVKTTEVTFIAGLPGGNRNNNGTFNNVGNNGNWWSASEFDTTNAWNRNLNNNNANVNRNNNNKTNGFSVRVVRDLTLNKSSGVHRRIIFLKMQLSLFRNIDKQALTESIFEAYFDCRRNKRNTANALRFEKHLERNLFQLVDEIYDGSYTPGKSIAFIVTRPVKREVFAADFKDRVVHHYVINKLNPYFEKRFINNSFACRVGKGTHHGIFTVRDMINKTSDYYKKDSYILKLDIQGFFMHINRDILFRKLKLFIQRNYKEQDKDLILELCHKIIFNDPAKNCVIKGEKTDWNGLPKNKSLFHSPRNCGLPIGNLTSQVFANFYLNGFDHFMEKQVGKGNYARYVDDFLVVHRDKDFLKQLITRIKAYLKERIRLELHPKKIYLQHISKGVKFLGAILKRKRIYVANKTKGNMHEAISNYNQQLSAQGFTKELLQKLQSTMNSYLGMIKHFKTYTIRQKMVTNLMAREWFEFFFVSEGYLKIGFIKSGMWVNMY